MSRLPLSFCLTALTGCGAGYTGGARHVLLISIDTLRADRLGCYGYELETSPRIDELAAEGVLFETAISAASTTLASHTSLMTGTWPHTHGVARNGYRVPDKNELLAEVLAEAGFRTAGFIGAVPLDPAVNFDQGFEFYGAGYTMQRTGQTYSQLLERRAKEVTDAVLGWLDRDVPAGPGTRLFLFAHYFDCHAPYAAPGAFAGRFRESLPELEDADAELSRVRRSWRTQLRTGQPIDPELGAAAAGLVADYCAEIAYVDRHVGRLLDGLEQRGILAETLVVLTADHGETFTEHEPSFTHGYTVFESEIRVPLILRPPQNWTGNPGRRVEHIVSGIDVAPTILELVGVPAPEAMEGVSFAAALDGRPQTRGPLFAEATKPTGKTFRDDPVWANHSRYQCVRTGRWKYARRDPDELEHLFDLSEDPGELNDLLAASAADTELPYDALQRLRSELESWRSAASSGGRAKALESSDHAAALRALGYVDDE